MAFGIYKKSETFKLKKKIIIIGGSSLLSLSLVFFLKKKYNLYLACNTKKPKIPKVKSFFVNFIKKDLKKIFEKIDPDIVIICSAITNIEVCEKDKKKAKEVNFYLPKLITDICKIYKFNLIFISTDQVYKDNPKSSDEKSKILGVNYYSKTKILAEKYINKNVKNSLILRTNFFGYGPTYRKSFSDSIIYSALQKKKQEYFVDNMFSSIYIPYFAKLLIKLIEQNIFGIYNLSSTNFISKYKFAIKIFEKFSLNKKYLIKGFLKKRKDLVNRPFNMNINNLKLMQKLNMKIPTIEKQIEKMRKDHKSKYFLFLKGIKLEKK